MSIVGRYEMVSSDKFGDYLKAIGVGMIQRNLAEKVKPTVEVHEDNGRYTIKTLTSVRNVEVSFILGEEFDETTPDGRKARSIFRKEGNKIIHTQRIVGGEESVITREFLENEMVATFAAKNVIAKRVFKRVV